MIRETGPRRSKAAFARALPASAAARSAGPWRLRCDSYAASQRPSALAAATSREPGWPLLQDCLTELGATRR